MIIRLAARITNKANVLEEVIFQEQMRKPLALLYFLNGGDAAPIAQCGVRDDEVGVMLTRRFDRLGGRSRGRANSMTHVAQHLGQHQGY